MFRLGILILKNLLLQLLLNVFDLNIRAFNEFADLELVLLNTFASHSPILLSAATILHSFT